jgi:hypothetical protein
VILEAGDAEVELELTKDGDALSLGSERHVPAASQR